MRIVNTLFFVFVIFNSSLSFSISSDLDNRIVQLPTNEYIPLKIMLDKISQQLGITYFTSEINLDEPVILSNDRIPINILLDRLLKNYNSMFYYNQKGEIYRINILGNEKSQNIKLQLGSEQYIKQQNTENQNIQQLDNGINSKQSSAELEKIMGVFEGDPSDMPIIDVAPGEEGMEIHDVDINTLNIK